LPCARRKTEKIHEKRSARVGARENTKKKKKARVGESGKIERGGGDKDEILKADVVDEKRKVRALLGGRRKKKGRPERSRLGWRN